MPLDPALVPLVAQYAAAPPPTDIAEERARELAVHQGLVGVAVEPAPPGVEVSEVRIPGAEPGVLVRARVYRVPGAPPRAGLVFAHGGGWCTGSIETAHEHCAWLALRGHAVVVSVGYRLAPEHRFPAGLQDLSTALAWVARYAHLLGIDPDRLAVGGQSAGANLAAAVALLARDRGGPPIALQLLELPVLDLTPGSSVTEFDEEFPFLRRAAERLPGRYLADPAQRADPHVSPLLATDLSGLPPAVLLACEIDPARDDATRYARRLVDAGVPAVVDVHAGLLHGTQNLTLLLPAATTWREQCAAALRSI